MNTIEQAREVSKRLRESTFTEAEVAANTINALKAELAALSLDLHTETAAVIALRAELIEIKSQFEMTLEREVYWNSRWVLVSDQLASIKGQQPVATVLSWTNGSYSRNYKLDWHNNAPEGAKLYLAAGAQERKPLTEFERMQIIGEEFPLPLVESIIIQKIDSVCLAIEAKIKEQP